MADGGRSSSGAGSGARLARYLERIAAGDEAARDELLRAYAPYAMSVASRAVGRFVRLGHDDAANIALIAMDEAARTFAPAKGSFLSFSAQVIRRRVIDHLRREGRRSREVPAGVSFSPGDEDDGAEQSPGLPGLAGAIGDLVSQAYEDGVARRDELAEFGRQLAEFGIDFDTLAEVAPRHVDARENAKDVARLIASDAGMRRYLLERKQLPLRELEMRGDMKRKTLERHRKYIIAITLVLIGEYDELHEYVQG